MANFCSRIIQSTWARYSSEILCLAIGLTLLSVVLRLFPESHRLLFSNASTGAVDLRLRHGEIRGWFSGLPVYTGRLHSGYPPASYVLLFPFLGWLSESAARWWWGLLTVVELSLLSVLCIRFTKTTVRAEQLLMVLTFFSAYPITLTLGNGQLGIHMFTLFWCAMILFMRGTTWRTDLPASVLMLFAATKPNFSAPLFWIVLFALGRLRPMLLVASGYVLLTVFALGFQTQPVLQLLHDFSRISADVIGTKGGAHIAVWMRFLGLSEWTSIASLGLILALGCWIFANRRANTWILLGISALVARIWTYHQPYDDLLILFAMLPLLHWLREDPTTGNLKVLGGCLLGTAWLFLFIPARTVDFAFPWNLPYEIGLPLIWVAMMLFLNHVKDSVPNAKMVAKGDALCHLQ